MPRLALLSLALLLSAPAWAITPSLVQHAMQTGGTAAYPGSVTAGNLLVVAVGCIGDAGTVSDTRGTSYTRVTPTGSDGGAHAYLYYGFAPTGGANTVTQTCTSWAFTEVMEFAITGVTVDVAIQQADPLSATVTLSQDDLIITAESAYHSECSFSGASPLKQADFLNGADAFGVFWYDSTAYGRYIKTEAGSYTFSHTWLGGRTDNRTMLLVAFRPTYRTPLPDLPTSPAAMQSTAVAGMTITTEPVMHGSLLVAAFSWEDGVAAPTCTDTIGTSYTTVVPTGVQGDQKAGICYGVAPKTWTPTITVANSGATWAEMAATEVLNVQGVSDAAVLTAGASTSITTTASNTFIFALASGYHSATTFSAVAPFTQDLYFPGGAGYTAIALQHYFASGAGTYTAAVTGANLDGMTIEAVAFKTADSSSAPAGGRTRRMMGD